MIAKTEEQKAWREYHKRTRNEIGSRYEEVEPWAWAQLQIRLKSLGRKRQPAKTKERQVA